MRHLVLIAATAASLAVSAPAVFAQDMPPSAMPPSASGAPMDGMERPHGDWTLERREEWLQGRIMRASDHGWLSGGEQQRGQGELDAIRTEKARLRERDGGRLSEADRGYIAHRIDELNRTLRWTGDNPPAPWMDR